MKQVAQYQDGRLELQEVAEPEVGAGMILVRTVASVISPGTEKMKVEQGKMSLLAKARARPDQVRKVVQSVRTLGWRAAYEKVRNRLESPTPLGYSAAGEVMAVGEGVKLFRVGDKVACGGAECAHHAEVLCVPELLAALVPEEVPLDHAAFTTLGSIALEAVRQSGVSLGERVLVVGQGLVGLLVTGLMKAAGVRVMGCDLSAARLLVAKQMGAEQVVDATADVPAAVREWTAGMGVDAVMLCVGGKDARVMQQAVDTVRDRGTIVIVGMHDAELSWKQAYLKDVTVKYSRSYGPGRYDANYEWGGQDYPVGYVRWTENRNFQAVLELLRSGSLKVEPLVSRRVELNDVLGVYEEMVSGADLLGVVVGYEQGAGHKAQGLSSSNSNSSSIAIQSGVSVIGAGNFLRTMLLPALKGKIALDAVVNATGLSAGHVQRKFGFASASTKVEDAWAAGAVMIGTRHDSHAALVLEGLKRGKQVFVEKPLCLTVDELREIDAALSGSTGSVMVGFNRRFSPSVLRMKELLGQSVGMLHIHVNAGVLDPSHWYAREAESGGRILGEACHFYDCACFLLGQPVSVMAQGLSRDASDTVLAQIQFRSGAVAQVNYCAEGSHSLAKESFRLVAGSMVMECENALKLRVHGARAGSVKASKGHAEEMAAWLSFLDGEAAHPMSWQSIYQSMALTFAVQQSVRESRVVVLAD